MDNPEFDSPNETPLERSAMQSLIATDELLFDLRSARIAAGLTTLDLSERMGCAVEWVEEMECYWTDPKLSEIRRYALAVGVVVEMGLTPAT